MNILFAVFLVCSPAQGSCLKLHGPARDAAECAEMVATAKAKPKAVTPAGYDLVLAQCKSEPEGPQHVEVAPWPGK